MISTDNMTALHSSFEVYEENGETVARISKIEKLDEDDTNSYVRLNEMDFQNGTIEVDVCGKLRDDAPAHARGFIGIYAFFYPQVPSRRIPCKSV